jgi:hypothetical protein
MIVPPPEHNAKLIEEDKQILAALSQVPAPCGCSALTLAKQFHDTYERLAPSFGYETRAETREFDPDSPNGRLMIAVCQEIIEQNDKRQGRGLSAYPERSCSQGGCHA